MISAVQYLHENGIAHRDLKLNNLFLDESMNIKVADFGISKSFVGSEQLTTRIGTEGFKPPEFYTLEEGGSYDGPAVDVFACGVILYTILTGMIFPASNNPIYKQLFRMKEAYA